MVDDPSTKISHQATTQHLVLLFFALLYNKYIRQQREMLDW